jgi:hypothetical protein
MILSIKSLSWSEAGLGVTLLLVEFERDEKSIRILFHCPEDPVSPLCVTSILSKMFCDFPGSFSEIFCFCELLVLLFLSIIFLEAEFFKPLPSWKS